MIVTPSDGMVLSCRPASFHAAEKEMFARLADWGVRYVEPSLPEPAEAGALLAQLRQHGLRAATVQVPLHLEDAHMPETMDEAARRVREEWGAQIIFTSAKTNGAPLPSAYDALRRAGEAVGRHGVTLVLETHPDLVTNGAVAAQTMRAVNHPHVRINWDTANIHYYNENVDGLYEMEATLPWIAAIHLKDTSTGFHAWNFPGLGEGKVDFGAILGRLKEVGFRGPCTMEIEGVQGESLSPAEHVERVHRSVLYLRSLGYFPPLPPLS